METAHRLARGLPARSGRSSAPSTTAPAPRSGAAGRASADGSWPRRASRRGGRWPPLWTRSTPGARPGPTRRRCAPGRRRAPRTSAPTTIRARRDLGDARRPRAPRHARRPAAVSTAGRAWEAPRSMLFDPEAGVGDRVLGGRLGWQPPANHPRAAPGGPATTPGAALRPHVLEEEQLAPARPGRGGSRPSRAPGSSTVQRTRAATTVSKLPSSKGRSSAGASITW